MTELEQLIEALTILRQYEEQGHTVLKDQIPIPQDDWLFAITIVPDVSLADGTQLESLGWTYNAEWNQWRCETSGRSEDEAGETIQQ